MVCCRSTQDKVRARFVEIQAWLQVDDACLAAFTALGRGAVAWVLQGPAARQAEVASRFPVVWRAFLDETGQDDRIAANCRPREAVQAAGL